MLATRPVFALVRPGMGAGVSSLGLRSTTTSLLRIPTSYPAASSSSSTNSITNYRSQLANVGSVRSNVSTTKLSQAENLELLNKHRATRPTSPHFTIYQPQYTWILSIANRITGTGLSVLLYGYFAAYAILPLVGHADLLTSASLVDFVATTPAWLKLLVKVPLAAAFNFHNFNGLRHLAWDWGIGLTLKGVYRGAYTVMAATAVATVAMCMI